MGLKRDTLMCGERRRDGGFQSDKASLGQKNGVGSIGVGSIAERGAASDGARQPGNRGLGAREMEGTGNKAWGGGPQGVISFCLCPRACVHFAKAVVPYLMQMEKMQFLVSVP